MESLPKKRTLCLSLHSVPPWYPSSRWDRRRGSSDWSASATVHDVGELLAPFHSAGPRGVLGGMELNHNRWTLIAVVFFDVSGMCQIEAD
eukprot:6458702-Amphidinium_carterae.1